jgi:cytochrome P450
MIPDQQHEVAFIDIFDPSFRTDSPEVLAAREANWYARTPLGLAVLRYDEAAALLRDRRLGPGTRQLLTLQGVTEGPLVDWWNMGMLNVDDSTHQRLRRLVGRAFSSQRVEALRPAMRAVAHELVDAFADGGECDFVTAFADPYPVRIICQLLGIPPEEHGSFQGWADDLGLAFGLTVAQNLERIEAALAGLYELTDRLVAERRHEPEDDLLTALIAAEETSDRLNGEELRVMLTGLIFAGHDTTRNQLGLAMATFVEHPEQWARLGRDASLASGAVAELLRVAPVVPITSRVALDDFEFHGLPIPQDTFLAIFVGSAQMDLRVFGSNGFDITRKQAAPNLTFGGGIHYCLGSLLAQAELTEALPVLASRLRRPQLAGEVSWRPPVGIWGPTRLPLRFEPETPTLAAHSRGRRLPRQAQRIEENEMDNHAARLTASINELDRELTSLSVTQAECQQLMATVARPGFTSVPELMLTQALVESATSHARALRTASQQLLLAVREIGFHEN